MIKPRPEFKAWEKLTITQIDALENAVRHLKAEALATQKLIAIQKRGLKAAQKRETH